MYHIFSVPRQWIPSHNCSKHYYIIVYSNPVSLFQSVTGDKRNEQLLDILVRRDNALLPRFYEALEETGQEHVARILKGQLL